MFTLVLEAVWMLKMYRFIAIFAFLFHFSNTESTTKDVRLVGGDHQAEGRVEIWFNGQWRTVCDNEWGEREAAVICRQLGLGLFGWAEKGDIFGEGTGLTWIGIVSCNGSEKSIMDCMTHISDDDEWYQCDKSQNVGVTCASEMRLRNGTNYSEQGYLEIYSERKRKWEFVKDDSLLDQDTLTAVCRQLELGIKGSLVSIRGSSGDVGSGADSELLESLHDVVFATKRDLPVISCFGDVNPCHVDNPCSPNGVCKHKLEDDTVMCLCSSGFTGARCEEEEEQINFTILLVLMSLMLLFAVLVLVCVIAHNRKRKRNTMFLDNEYPSTTGNSGKNEYVSLSEK